MRQKRDWKHRSLVLHQNLKGADTHRLAREPSKRAGMSPRSGRQSGSPRRQPWENLRQAEQAREAGDRNLAPFSVARFAGLFSPLFLPTACAVGYETVARFAGSSGDDFIDILTSTSRTAQGITKAGFRGALCPLWLCGSGCFSVAAAGSENFAPCPGCMN